MKSENLLKIEDSIIQLAKSDNKTVHFGYYTDEYHPHLNFSASVITVNSITKESFLLKEVKYRNSYEDALNEILDYMINMKVSHKSYTVEWCKMENGQLGKYNTSYFYCRNAKEVIKKFYYGKNEEEYDIFVIKQNPIS